MARRSWQHVAAMGLSIAWITAAPYWRAAIQRAGARRAASMDPEHGARSLWINSIDISGQLHQMRLLDGSYQIDRSIAVSQIGWSATLAHDGTDLWYCIPGA